MIRFHRQTRSNPLGSHWLVSHSAWSLIALSTLFVLTACQFMPDGEGRFTRELEEDWRFIREDVEGATLVSFDDSEWESIDLPHTWNAKDGQDGGGNYYRGIGWYRRTIKLSSGRADRKLFLEFDGTAIVTDVYVNGAHAGQHRGGYTAFRFDITPFVQFGEKNLIAVKVDNSPFPDIAPLGGDFTIFGGIYRGVRLVMTHPLHIDALDHASPGVYLRPTRVTKERAEVEVSAEILNEMRTPARGEVVTTLFDAKSAPLATLRETIEIAPGESQRYSQQLEIDAPHLWHGRRDPYLYQVRVETFMDGKVTDAVTQPLGLRFFHVDPERGFFLNGEPYRLYGASRHQDKLDKGYALSRADHEADFALLKEIGATTLRLAHYPQDPYVYELADREGIVIWSEVPLVGDMTDSHAFRANVELQLVEMIRQQFNHPSVHFWGIYNEVLIGALDKPITPLVERLNQRAKREDPYRLTTAAGLGEYDLEHPIRHITDVIALNKYYGWYSGEPRDFDTWAQTIHEEDPERPVGVSEYGAGASIAIHSEVPERLDHSEEYQAFYHEQHWKYITAHPALWGTYVWNFFDFGVDFREEGDHPGRNDKGLVTYDRETRKDSFYFYKSHWSSEPMVYLTGRRFNPRHTKRTRVKAYSNQPALELEVDGQSHGVRNNENNVFVWEDVPLAMGANQITAFVPGARARLQDRVSWERSLRTDTALASRLLGISNEKRFIAHVPHAATVDELAEMLQLPENASFEVIPAQAGSEALVLPGATLEVTAEDRKTKSRYRVTSGALSLGRPVKVSSSASLELPGTAAKALGITDGDPDTLWFAGAELMKTSFPEWFQIDLGANYYLKDMELAWPKEQEMSRGAITAEITPYPVKYSISVSTDGENYREVVDRRANDELETTRDTLDAEARFVKVIIHDNASYLGVALMGLKLPYTVVHEATIHGGMIASESLEIDYDAKLIHVPATITTVAQLVSRLVPVAEVSIEAVCPSGECGDLGIENTSEIAIIASHSSTPLRERYQVVRR